MFKEMAVGILEKALSRLSPVAPVAGDVPTAIRSLIAAEANAIDATMSDLGVFAWVVDEEIVVSGIGGFIRYTIETGPNVRASNVKAIKEDIEIVVNRVRQRIVGGESVELNWNAGLSFDLPYPGERKLLKWDRIPETRSLRPMQMICGLDYTGYKPFTRTLAFSKGETTHIFVGGGSGSGKSVAVCGLIASLCMGTSPAELQIIVIDTKRCKDLAKVGGMPHVAMYHEPGQCVSVLKSIHSEMRRRQAGSDDSTKIVVVIEEVSALIDLAGKEAITRLLNSFSTTARSAGIHMIACTQYPNKKILDREFMVNFDVKLCGAFASQQAMRQVLDLEGFTGALLPKCGAFYVNRNGALSRIQTPALFDDQLLDVVGQAQAKWTNVEPYRMQIDLCAEAAAVESAAEPDGESDEAMIKKILESYDLDGIFDDEGKVRRGMRANLLELLFGTRVDKNKPARTLDRLLESIA